MIQRRAVEVLICSLALLIAFVIAGCGGGSSSSKVGPATTVKITPTAASVEFGKFVTLVASGTDANGKTVDPATITWSSSNTTVATVTSSGANGSVCAGTWDSLTTPTVCTPATTAGDVTITAKSGSASATATISVHPHIARLEVATPVAAGACVSQTQTAQFSVRAFDVNNNLVSLTPGSISWTVADTTVATIDANGVVTAKRPGFTTVNANVSGTVGLAQGFVTCPPATITLGTQNVTPLETAFTLAAGGTRTLAASVTDTNGNPITDIQLTYSSSNSGIASVPTGATTALTATVTAVGPGSTTVVASCTPPSCNSGTGSPYFSNPVTVTVSGTSSPKVVVTGTTASGVVIIDNNTPGAQIAFPTVNGKTPVANSLVISPDGNVAYIGTDQGLLRLDLSNNTFLSTLSNASRVLAVSQNGSKVLASDFAGTVFVYDIPSSTVQLLSATSVTDGDFSTDNYKALMTGGSTLYIYFNGATSLSRAGLAGAASDLKFSPQGSFALTAEPSSGELLANCSNSPLATSPGNVGSMLAKPNTPNRMWGVDTGNIYEINLSGTFATTSTSDCRPDVSAVSTPRALGVSVTPVQLIATPDGQAAYLVNNSPILYAAKAGVGSVAPIALTSGGTGLSGGVTPDSANLYVGTSAGDVQRIDVGSGAVVQSINVGLKKADGTTATPDFVAVRSR